MVCQTCCYLFSFPLNSISLFILGKKGQKKSKQVKAKNTKAARKTPQSLNEIVENNHDAESSEVDADPNAMFWLETEMNPSNVVLIPEEDAINDKPSDENQL